MYQSGLTGSIPSEIGNLDLRRFQVYENELNSSIPEEFWNNAGLNDLRLDSNMLTGDLSSRLGDLVDLTDLRLAFNQLGGFLPNEFVRLSNLRKSITKSSFAVKYTISLCVSQQVIPISLPRVPRYQQQ